MTATALNQEETSQLSQTIEMFEIIVQSQSSDVQSLEILKEAYLKLGREEDFVNTSKRIADAYLQLGQLSSAILEYETVLQRRPDDGDVRDALKQIEEKAGRAVDASEVAHEQTSDTDVVHRRGARGAVEKVDDGRATLRKIFVDSKLITAGDFDLCWRSVDLFESPPDVVEPLVETLHKKQILPFEKSLRVLSDKSRLPFLPLERYDLDIELARSFPAHICRRWCVMPFDKMSKAIMVATVNPFNQQAAKELAATTSQRLLWYLATPNELIINLRKAFR